LVGEVDEGDVGGHDRLLSWEGTRRGRHPVFAGWERPGQVNVGQNRPSRVEGHHSAGLVSRGCRWLLGTGTERRVGHATALGPSWGRESGSTAVNHGAQRATTTAARQPHPPWLRPSAVHGMQEARGSNPLSSTSHNASSTSALGAACQRFARGSRGVRALVALRVRQSDL
jgi:hypothetical protein